MIEVHVEQKSIEWQEARSGIVTGTSLKRAIGKPAVQETLMYELIAARMAQNIFNDFTSSAMDHGNDTEDMAVKIAGKRFDVAFEKIGMIKSEIVKGFGMSPDGISRDDGKIVGGIECKCPDSKKHIQWMSEETVPKKHPWMVNGVIPSDHVYQVLSPFVISDDIEWWIFMSYDYRVYQRPTYYVKVKRKDVVKEVEVIREKLTNFINKVDDKHSAIVF